jgi:hypothetical protein
MFTRRKISPEWQAITSAQAAQISEARASRAAAIEALKNAVCHLEIDEAFDLLTAHYAGRVDPQTLHAVIQRHERAADALRTETDRLDGAEALARRSWDIG